MRLENLVALCFAILLSFNVGLVYFQKIKRFEIVVSDKSDVILMLVRKLLQHGVFVID
jgi:hypothetical protein